MEISSNNPTMGSSCPVGEPDPKSSWKDKAIIAAKITVVALTILTILGAAATAAYFAAPLFAAGGVVAIATGIAIAGGALGFSAGAIGAPFLAMSYPKDQSCANTPMYQKTDHNFRDCVIFIAKSLGVSAAGGLTGILIVPGVIGVAIVGGAFFYALSQGVGH